MKIPAFIALAAGVLTLFGGGTARADFEILLRDGGNMIVDKYEVSGEKLVAYKGTGKVEFPLSQVVNVRDRGIDEAAAAEAQKPVKRAEPPQWAPVAPRPASSTLTPEDARARDGELSRAIAIAYRDLRFAEYRGEAKDALQKRKEDIAKLEAERSSLKKLVDAR